MKKILRILILCSIMMSIAPAIASAEDYYVDDNFIKEYQMLGDADDEAYEWISDEGYQWPDGYKFNVYGWAVAETPNWIYQEDIEQVDIRTLDENGDLLEKATATASPLDTFDADTYDEYYFMSSSDPAFHVKVSMYQDFGGIPLGEDVSDWVYFS